MDLFWNVVVAVAASTAVWVPVIVWVTKRLVEQRLATTMEGHKSELAIVVKERELRFGALVAKRASGLVDLFTALDNVYVGASLACVTAGATRAVGNSPEMNAAVSLHRANLLYVDTGLSKRIEAFFGAIREADTEQSRTVEHANKLRAQRDAIEADFRVLLGSELSPPPPGSLKLGQPL